MSKKSFYKQSAKVEAASTSMVFEVYKPSKFIKSASGLLMLQSNGRWRKWLLATGLITCLTIIVLFLGMGFWYWKGFEQAAHISLSPLISTVWNHRHQLIIEPNSYKTFLLLGLDQSSNQRETSLLTDTMMLAAIHDTGAVRMVSLPRDLWVDSLKTKINALYYYGQQTNPNDGIPLVNSVVSEMTGMSVDYSFVINMDTLKSLVDAVGGVDVIVARPFVDEEYPREIDLSSKDPAVLYETVVFEAGEQHMDGDRALTYIRSRHSKDPLEGTDEGREQRQQILLTALKQKLFEPKTYADPQVAGALYAVWKSSVKTTMSDLDLILLAKQLGRTSLSITSSVVPVDEASTSGLIYHPKVGPANQWIYLPHDETWGEMQQWFSQHL